MSDSLNMDARSVSSCLFIIFIALSPRVEAISVEKAPSSPSPDPTVSTDASSTFPGIEISESKVSKNYATFASEPEEAYSREPDVEGAPPDHVVPYSEHENPEEPSTRSKYTNGNVGPGPGARKVELDFVPTKVYAQVRKSHTVKRVPREDALESASNEEEILAAPRLREVVTKSKANTVYTEEGYEDAAYDHGGHVRDADFEEDYTKKIGEQEAAELNDVENEPGIKEGDEAGKPRDYDTEKSAEKLDRLWQDPSINPKLITENEIEKLERDLESEYEESEKKAETRVPENLENPHGSEEQEESEPRGATRDYGSENEVEERHDESDDDLDEVSKREASTESPNNEIRENFDFKANEHEFTSENPSVDYAKVFWDYFKSVGNDHTPDKFFGPSEIGGSTENHETSSPETFSIAPSFPSARAALDSYSDFTFAPSTELNSFVTSRMDHAPSAASLYESWKRQDENRHSEEYFERDSDSWDSYVTNSAEETREADDFEKNTSGLNLQNGEGSMTLIGPKKLSYTVIIRPSEKPRTETRPCDDEARKRPGERTLVVKSSEPASPEAVNDFSNANDFTGIEAPLPAVPPRRLTYADFVSHSYASRAHSSVTPEIGTTLKQISNVERPRLGKKPKSLHPRYGQFRARANHPRQLYPVRKLLPPPSVDRRKYPNLLNVQSAGRAIKRQETIVNFHPWPGMMRVYRTLERRILPRRRRSTKELGNQASPSRDKMRDDAADPSSVKQSRLKRNPPGESDRLVEADYDAAPEKSTGPGNSLGANGEKLLREAPRIVDEVIDGEIASRFKDDGDSEQENSEEGGEGKRENIDVPDFEFSEVTENEGREKIVAKPALRKAPLDLRKYPFYRNSDIPRSSALKYVTNPRSVPRKTFGGSEFYDSRDRYRECEDVKPDLDGALPSERSSEEQEDEEDGGEQRGSRPRLHGLGDRLDCFRAKYFDDNPLDNPLFLEETVGQPRLPEELDPRKLNLRIFDPPRIEAQRRVSERPELTARRTNRTRSTNQSSNRSEGRANRITAGKDAGAEQSRVTEGRTIPKRHRIRKLRPRTTTEAPVIPTTPYERQVYEDVMGTIKNLAGLYETFGEPSTSATSFLPEENRAPAAPREKKIDFQSVHITERPRGFTVQGLLPPEPTEPPAFQRYRIIPYRTNKVSYRTRLRLENAPGGGAAKLGYFRTVTVHKRSVDSEITRSDLDPAASRNIGALPTHRLEHANSTNRRDSGSGEPKVDEEAAASERIVYTVQDRIRHSKPRGNVKFANLETSASENVKSREPRISRVPRRNVTKPGELPAPATNFASTSPPSGRHYLDEPNEMYKIQYSTTHGRQIEPNDLQRRSLDEASEEHDGEETLEEDAAEKQDRRESYGTQEPPGDPNSGKPSPGEPDFVRLREYLESDPPGYSEAFGKKSSSSEDEGPEIPHEDAESRQEVSDARGREQEEETEDEEERGGEKASESLVDEDSSSGSVESNASSEQSKSAKKSADDSEVEEAGEEQEDDEDTHAPLTEDETASNVEDSEKEFERFASRPFSPFESYEDSKYMDLGPRLSKPYFYHPSFSTLNYRRRKYSKDRERDESTESGEKRSKYVFPWDADGSRDEQAEKSSEESLRIEKYEYPWERRERLARERRRKEKEKREHERLYGFSDDDDEDEDDGPESPSGTELRSKRLLPWKDDAEPSKRSGRRKTSRSRATDNEEMSSEHRPRFSSRYKTPNSSLNDDNDPAATSIQKSRKNEPSKLGELRNGLLRVDKNAETSVASTHEPPAFTVPLKKAARRRVQTQTTSTTPSTKNSFDTKRKKRVWPSTTSTTKKPILRRRPQNSGVARESLGSGSQKDVVVVVNPSGGNIRRRRLPVNRSRNSTSDAKISGPGYQKAAPNPQRTNAQQEESTMKSIATKSTTPKVKTTEHRSRFSKEEIITKTSYPGRNDKNIGDSNQGITGNEENGDFADSRDKPLNESVRKVSITTKETPEHIYRTEEIDKNGVKGKFVSVTPNNGTNSSLDMDQTLEHAGLLDHEEMLKEFENSDESFEEQDSGMSSMRADSNILANLLMQVPPHVVTQSTLDPQMEKKIDFPPFEGSGTIQDDENHDENDPGTVVRNKFVKDPNHRLYYYVEV